MSPKQSLNIALIGCGKMGSAMLRGWLDAGIGGRVHVLEPQGLPPGFGDFTPSPVDCRTSAEDFAKAASGADVYVLAVKPQIMEEVCRSIAAAVPREALVLSIAAGQTIESFERRFGEKQAIVRAMPNTPAALGESATVAVANPHVSQKQKDQADALLRSMGMVKWIDDENLMDAVTALSGSGPAYVFLMIETLAKAGEKAGLPADLAMTLARQTVIGSAALAESEPGTPAETLRRNVTSPGGTTAAALKVLMDTGELQNLFDRAIEAARDRGRELSKPGPKP